MKGHIRKRGQNSWGLVVEIGRDQTGKRKQKWHSFKGTKRDAQIELRRILSEIDDGIYVDPKKVTVAEFLDKWIETRHGKVGAKTLSVYEEIVRCHLKPDLGAMELKKLDSFHLDEYYAKKLTSGRRNGKGGLAPATVHKHHRIIREALQRAVGWKWIARNPADSAEPPKVVQEEMQALDKDGIAVLLGAAQGTHLYYPTLMAVTTGMRRGEILGLKWMDIAGQKLTVRRSVEQTKESLQLKAPKTKNSTRSISMPALLADALKRHKVEQAKIRLHMGPGYQDQGLVFCNVDGSLWSPDAFTAAFRRLVRPAGLRCRFHDLRHTHATQLLGDLKINPKVVSERLGHCRVGFTLDTYAHVLDGMQEEAAAKVDEALAAIVGNAKS